MNQLKNIILKDIYNQYCNILLNISQKYNIDFQKLHDLYLSEFSKL